MIVHLDGDGTATFMIVLSTFLPIYKRLGMSRLMLAGIVALSVGPMHLVPWSGTSVRAMSTLNTDAGHMFSRIFLPCWVDWPGCYLLHTFWTKGKKRLGIIEFDYRHTENLDDEQKRLRRPKIILINAALTISLITILLMGKVPAPVLFIAAAIIALLINYNKLPDQQKVMKAHGSNIFWCRV